MQYIKTNTNITIVGKKVQTIGIADIRFNLLSDIDNLEDSEIEDILDYAFLKSVKFFKIEDGKPYFRDKELSGDLAKYFIKEYQKFNSVSRFCNLLFNIEKYNYNKEKCLDILNKYEVHDISGDGFLFGVITDKNKDIDFGDTPFARIKKTDYIYNFIINDQNINDILKDNIQGLGKKSLNFFRSFILDIKTNHIDNNSLRFIVECSSKFSLENLKTLISKNLIDLKVIDFLSKFIPSEKRLFNSILNSSGDTTELEFALKNFEKIENHIEIPNQKFSVSDVIEFVNREYQRISGNTYSDLYLNSYDFIRNLENRTFNGIELVVPKTSFDLIKWGTIMNNCIAGREGSAKSGRKIPLALYKNGRLLWCFEIVKGAGYGDFQTYKRERPSETLRAALSSFLIENGFNKYAPFI